ncbi:MAG: glycerophosphodiester phosphodiesterase family protein [Pirellulales bacterium]|nr:glycerophosphodiester phosphodiesterase family protein [Pirellulales bacterium]
MNLRRFWSAAWCVYGVLGYALSAPAAEPSLWPFFQPVVPARDVQVMIHRGLARQAPENTAPAIELAIADGLEWVEVDVRLSRDGQHVLFHDGTLDGKTNGQGALADRTLAELKQLDAGAWFAPQYSGTRLLTLAECLQLAHQRVNLYLDCKTVDPARLVEEIDAAAMPAQVVVYGDAALAAQVTERSQGRVAVMVKWRPGTPPARLVERVSPAIVEIDADDVTADVVAAFHALKVYVQAKVLGADDRPETWDRMTVAGVDFLQTDLPERIVARQTLARLPRRPVQMTCHRGASRYAPENTLPALEEAAALGADYVEIDVHTSADGRLFLMHDGRCDRTTNGHGAIRELTGEAIQQLDAGSWFGAPFRGVHVPELDKFLAAVPPGLQIYFDAKAIAPERLVEAVQRHGLAERTIVYQGPGYLDRVRRLEPRLRLLAPLGRAADLPKLAEKLRPTAVDARWEDVSAELIATAHGLGVQVFADAKDDTTVEQLREAIRWGIDQIQTDHPLRLLRAMELEAAAADAPVTPAP